MSDLDMTLKHNGEAPVLEFGDVEYPFVSFILRSILTRSGSTC